MKVKTTLIVICVASLLSCLAFAGTILITPGVGVAQLKLQSKFSTIQKNLGAPSKVIPSQKPGVTFCYYKKYEIACLVENDTLIGITVFSPQYKLKSGIGVGSPQIEVIRSYRQEKIVNKPDGSVIYPEVGIGFSFAGGQVSHVYVITAELEK